MNDRYFVIVVNGTAGAGKDAFVRFCMEMLNDSAEISTVDPVKEAAKVLGWDGKKTAAARRMLSDIKDAWTRFSDGSFNYVCEQIRLRRMMGYRYFFVHCREPEEISKFAGYYNGRCLTVLIRRSGIEAPANHADQRVEDYPYDVVIKNNGTKQDLGNEAVDFCITHILNPTVLPESNWPRN